MSKVLKAVIYVRVSTDKQVDGYSLDMQTNILKKFAKNNNMTVTKIFREEGKSARHTFNRPVYLEMMEYIQKSPDQVDVVLSHKLDRMHRDETGMYNSLEILKKYGVRYIAVADGIDTADSDYQIQLAVQAALSANFSRNLSKETRKGQQAGAENCQHMGGKPPYGFRVSAGGIADRTVPTEVSVPETTVAQEGTAVPTETTASAETTTSAETTATTEQTTEAAPETQPAATEIPKIPGFTVTLDPIYGGAEDSPMLRQIQAIPDPDAHQSIEQHYEITELPPQFTYVRDFDDPQMDEYEKIYQIPDSSAKRTKDLNLWQFVQEQFEDLMTQYRPEYYEKNPGAPRITEVQPIRINGQPGCYYGIEYYTTDTPYIGYLLYWKQDGYVMLLMSNCDLSLEEMVKAAESVKPES